VPRPQTAVLAAAALLATAGCGGGTPAPSGTEPAPAVTAAPAPPPPPTTPAVGTRRYTAALETYCAGTNAALKRLAGSTPSRRDPAAPVAALARAVRAGVERLARLTPPAGARTAHLLVLAQGREAANRLDAGAQLARQGDADAATAALLDLQDLLPRLPAALRRAAPACA
jgi:hypothetical protein